jgi:hypothetical protein
MTESSSASCVGNTLNTRTNFPRTSEGQLIPKSKNLKSHLKQHIKSKKHQVKALEVQALALMGSKEESRSLKISGRIGHLCYYIVKNGRPYTDLSQLIYICMMNGSDMGDINHSL